MKPYAISAGHEATAQAAIEILQGGGNAFDAAIAAFIASWVAEPCMSSAGGGAFANVFTKEGKSWLFDFFCQTPKQKQIPTAVDFFPIGVEFSGTTEIFHVGKGATGVPGAIAGVFELHQKLATMPMKELVQPAIEMAKSGVVINDFQFEDFDLLKSILELHPVGKSIFFKEDKLKPIGEKLYMPQKADFLEYMAKEGRDAFYQGEVAQKIVSDYENGGGYLSLADFRDYEVIIRKPLAFSYRKNTILTNPLPSTGGSIIALLLKYLEAQKLPNIDSEEYILQWASAFESIEKIGKRPTDLAKALLQLDKSKAPISSTQKRGATTHFNILDRWGNAISLTSSNGEGSGYFVENTDIQLNNMLGEAALLPNGFHSWEQDVRLSSMMSPTMVLNENKEIEIILGSGGAGRIPGAIAQTLRLLQDYDLPVQEAINFPRLHLEGNTFHIEKGFSNIPNTGDLKPAINQWTETSLFFGGVHTILKKDETLEAGGDERRDGVKAVK